MYVICKVDRVVPIASPTINKSRIVSIGAVNRFLQATDAIIDLMGWLLRIHGDDIAGVSLGNRFCAEGGGSQQCRQKSEAKQVGQEFHLKAPCSKNCGFVNVSHTLTYGDLYTRQNHPTTISMDKPPELKDSISLK